VVTAGLTCCGGALSVPLASGALAQWQAAVHVPGVVDLSVPGRSGAITVAAAGRLALLREGKLIPFAAGYSEPASAEPYIALSTGGRKPASGCSFRSGVLYTLKVGTEPGVLAVNARGRVHRFVSLPSGGFLSAIAFDVTGRFGGRLLVTANAGPTASVYAIDCRRHVALLTSSAPMVEGGVAVAPMTFGPFGGDLIAADEISGDIFAVDPNGTTTLVAESGLSSGGDVGVESAAFVPSGFGAGWRALLSDRGTPGNPHPGDDAILALGGEELLGQGVQSGDLLVASEGGAETVAVSCSATCSVRHVASGPSVAHAEGHIVFTSGL
jgi:hypothetical protein